ncbi:hypothetical protein A6A19_08260 [Actinobacillus delphinicola]|uniref:glycosyltransferase n=1 Tax=Actinobacillus delphinicola TaxID=51161 RepID=UPI002440F499|nr:glycosyltransferase [Actinobacillus delphinicola]MDG6897966.1 hypothetical protein [Actinobacillus delphinicola]
MKILHITPNLKWAKIFIQPLAIKQVEEGHDVVISSPEENEVIDSDKISYIKCNHKLKNFSKHISLLFKIIKYVRKNKIEKIYCHTFLDSFLYIIFLRICTRAKVNYINHGVPYVGYNGILGIIFKIMEASNIICSHNIFSITPGMTKLLEDVNFSKKNILTFNPGTIAGINELYPSYKHLMNIRTTRSNNQIKILFVGRIEKRKGIYELIDAIKRSCIDIQLTIVGSGDLPKDLLKLRWIRKLGYLDNPKEVYIENDFLCVPSYHEGFGQVYLEAAKFGTIPISSNIPGPTDFIKDGYNGFTVEPMSIDSIVELLEKIKNNEYDLDFIQKNAFESVKCYEQDKVLKSNMELLND